MDEIYFSGRNLFEEDMHDEINVRKDSNYEQLGINFRYIYCVWFFDQLRIFFLFTEESIIGDAPIPLDDSEGSECYYYEHNC